jgi:hypothetical protein
MDDVNFPGWQPEKSLQVIEDNGRTRVLVRGPTVYEVAVGG